MTDTLDHEAVEYDDDNDNDNDNDTTELAVKHKKFRRKVRGTLDLLNTKEFNIFDMQWRDLAACKNHETYTTDDFFYVSVTQKNSRKVAHLQELCASCPVAASCLHEAMMFGYDGTWAGLSLKQRNAYLRECRENSVEGLTVDECATILNSMRPPIEPLPAPCHRNNHQSDTHLA